MKSSLLIIFSFAILSGKYPATEESSCPESKAPVNHFNQPGKTITGTNIAINKTHTQAITEKKESNIDCGHYIGQNFAGGIIFYLDASGCHGLIAAPYDQADLARWENGALTDTESYADGIGTGEGNTKMIIYKQEPNGGGVQYAAKICKELVIGAYHDWYLPSKYELNLMYYNIGQGALPPNTNIGNFPEAWYWSSTEVDNVKAWRQAFYVGLGWQFATEKFYDFRVRAIRSF